MAAEVYHLNIAINPSDLIKEVHTIIQKVRPSWKISEVIFKIFNEGISNQLVGCFPSSDEKAVLVRVYGMGTELFVDREAEQKTMIKLSKAGLGPSLIATFRNGLVYYFVPGSVLTIHSVHNPDIWPLVARRLGRMHRLPVQSVPAQLWAKLDIFLSLLPPDFNSHPTFARVKPSIPEKVQLCNEVDWLKKLLGNTSNPVVFCHNDLLLANIILNDTKDDVTFIDYEYSGANYQAYDIANHFNEYAGVDDVDYNRLPGKEFKRKWIEEYLKEFMETETVECRHVQELLSEVEHFAASSHLLWTMWSLVQAIHSKLDFNFAEYSLIRLNEYWNQKRFLECSL